MIILNPKRIQRKRTRGWHLQPGTVYVGRPSKWGNPFVAGKRYQTLALWVVINGVMSQDEIKRWYDEGGLLVRDAQHAVSLFRKYARWMIECTDGGKEWIEELRGKDLACWCPLEQPCHADVLLFLAN